MDYSPLDHFCKSPTWDTIHALDERRLREALEEIILDPSFNVDEAIVYISENHGEPIWGIGPEKKRRVLARLKGLISDEYQRMAKFRR